MQISGRVVLITGASSGIGAATARAMARRGGRVVLLASVIHRNLFSPTLASWLWFGSFTIATLILGLISARARQPQRHQDTL